MAQSNSLSSRSHEVYMVTFNCARNLVDAPVLSQSLFCALPDDAGRLPEVLAISLQEVAPLAYSFLGGSLVAPYFQEVTKAVALAARRRAHLQHANSTLDSPSGLESHNGVTNGVGEDYEDEESRYVQILTRHVGMTALMLFVREDLSDQIYSIKTAGAGVGLWDMGNKGAVGARMLLEDGTELTFVAAHLAPYEWLVQRRNQDYEKIVRNLGFVGDSKVQISTASDSLVTVDDDDAPGNETTGLLRTKKSTESEQPLGLYDSLGRVFFAGDLNYRTADTPPKEEHLITYPQPSLDPASESHITNFFKRDQLTRELAAGNVLHGFTEHPVTFPPTYKLHSKGAAPLEAGVEPKLWLWAPRRWPSYTDRILFLPLVATDPGIKVHGYKALPIQTTSDHRPVALSTTVTSFTKKSSGPEVVGKKAPFALNPLFAEARLAAKRREFVVGVLAYISVTREGNAILAGLLAGGIAGWWILLNMV